MDISNWNGGLERDHKRLFFTNSNGHVTPNGDEDAKGIRCYGPKTGKFLKFWGVTEKLVKGDTVYYVNKKSFKKWMANQLDTTHKKDKIPQLWNAIISKPAASKPTSISKHPKDQWVDFVNELNCSQELRQSVLAAMNKALSVDSQNRFVLSRLFSEIESKDASSRDILHQAYEKAIEVKLVAPESEEVLDFKSLKEGISFFLDVELKAFDNFQIPSNDLQEFKTILLKALDGERRDFNKALELVIGRWKLPDSLFENMSHYYASIEDRLPPQEPPASKEIHPAKNAVYEEKVDALIKELYSGENKERLREIVLGELQHAKTLDQYKVRVECLLAREGIDLKETFFLELFDFVAASKVFADNTTGMFQKHLSPVDSALHEMKRFCEAFNISPDMHLEQLRGIVSIQPFNLERCESALKTYCSEQGLDSYLVDRVISAYIASDMERLTTSILLPVTSVIVPLPKQSKIEVEIVFPGSILEKQQFKNEGKTAVINAANPRMYFGGGGLNAAFSEMCGDKKKWKQNAKNAEVVGRAYGDLNKGEHLRTGQAAMGVQVTTQSGNEMSLIHSLGPDLREDPDLEAFLNNEYSRPDISREEALAKFREHLEKPGGLKEQVKEAYKSALLVADKNECVNVQVPEIATGIYAQNIGQGQRMRIWREAVHEAFKEAVAEFSPQAKSVKEVKLVQFEPLPDLSMVSIAILRGSIPGIGVGIGRFYDMKKYDPGARASVIAAAEKSRSGRDFKESLKALNIPDQSKALLVKEFDRLAAAATFQIEGNKRAGQDNIEIIIDIAKLPPQLCRLSESTLPDILDLVNKHTLQKPYPCAKGQVVKIAGEEIYRQNHNGTHSARQLRYVEVLFEEMQRNGNDEARGLMNSLTADERLNLKLAAYFLRAGRVDESSHKNHPADDYNTRSAMIYEAYANQLGVKKETIQWIKNLINDSCKPLNICVEANKPGKSRFAYDLLTTAHELDLVRCFGKSHMEHDYMNPNGSTTQRLRQYLKGDVVAHNRKLFGFAIQLCHVTGSYISYLGKNYSNVNTFATCSLNGKVCLDVVRRVTYS